MARNIWQVLVNTTTLANGKKHTETRVSYWQETYPYNVVRTYQRIPESVKMFIEKNEGKSTVAEHNGIKQEQIHYRKTANEKE